MMNTWHICNFHIAMLIVRGVLDSTSDKDTFIRTEDDEYLLEHKKGDIYKRTLDKNKSLTKINA